MAEIPTVECPECGERKAADPTYWCPDCHDTGRVERPPLTPDEIAALPDGARITWLPADTDQYMLRDGVIVRGHINGKPGVRTWFGSGTNLATVLLYDSDLVWLAEEAE